MSFNQRALSKLLVNAGLDYPFWACFAYSLVKEIRKDSDNDGQTAFTDGERIVFYADFMDSLSKDDQLFVILHEMTHLALKHPLLIPVARERYSFSFDEMTFQEALDYTVNGFLNRANLIVPSNALYNYSFDDWTCFQIYEELIRRKKQEQQQQQQSPTPSNDPASQPQQGGDPPQTPPQQPDPEPEKKNDPPKGDYGQVKFPEKKNSKVLESQLDNLLLQASTISSAHGLTSAAIERLVKETFAVQIDLLTILSEILFAKNYDHYSMYKPNKIFLQDDIILPSRVEKTSGVISVCLDTSGSVSENDLAVFRGVLLALRQTFKGVRILIVPCDTSVCQSYRIEPDEPIDFSKVIFHGGGGTKFLPALRHAVKEEPDADCILYVTDGFNSWESQISEITIPIFWLMTNRHDPRWRYRIEKGTVVKIFGDR